MAAVLDQRANSVADLAAVLAAQESLGTQTQQNKDTEAKGRRDFQVQTMLDLAKEVEQGGLTAVETRMAELKQAQANADRLGEPMEMSKTQMRRELTELHARRNKMRWSARIVAETTEKVKATNGNLSPEQQQVRIREMLPSFPTPKASVPKRGSLRARLDRANAPVFSTEGIVVKWANHLDAEYAESWPETIAHEPMGFARHRAPKANQEAVQDVAEIRTRRVDAANSKRGKIERTPEQERDMTIVRGQIAAMVKDAVAKRSVQKKKPTLATNPESVVAEQLETA